MVSASRPIGDSLPATVFGSVAERFRNGMAQARLLLAWRQGLPGWIRSPSRQGVLSSQAVPQVSRAASQQTVHHIAGLDSLRFLCAVWVALHHGARPHVAFWLGLPPAFRDWNAIAYDGVAAVIVFFIISGLCVHYPYARSQSCELSTFYAQRFLRVGIPLLAVIAFERGAFGIGARSVAIETSMALRIVIWSLWCEFVFYALYPALLFCFRRVGFAPVIGVSFVAAYLTIIDHWHLLTYWQYPKLDVWITALPAWLLGCALAHAIATERLPVLPGSI
jgi:peptidoglycan/LPS O-acetylase OafA/YrhL